MLVLGPGALSLLRRGDPLTRHPNVCAACSVTSRRRLVSGAAALMLLSDAGAATALSPFALVATRYTDKDSGFTMLVPAQWTQLQLSPAAREVAGVYASFRDPDEASNTLGGALRPSAPGASL